MMPSKYISDNEFINTFGNEINSLSQNIKDGFNQLNTPNQSVKDFSELIGASYDSVIDSIGDFKPNTVEHNQKTDSPKNEDSMIDSWAILNTKAEPIQSNGFLEINLQNMKIHTQDQVETPASPTINKMSF